MSADLHKVMIVDDTPQNLQLLSSMLQKQNYQVFALPDGKMALNAARKNPPDLILLDIKMPQMDGYEVCKLLKADKDLAEIPVIFLSALHDVADKLQAFKAGGVDFITKPFQNEEVIARVSTHLKIHSLQRQLEEQNAHLEEIVERRTQKLNKAHKRLKLLDRIKSDFILMIAHELRTPLNGILGMTEVAFELCPSTDRVNDMVSCYKEARSRMLSLLDDALLLTEIETSPDNYTIEEITLKELFAEVKDNLRGICECSIELHAAESCKSTRLRCNSRLMTRALATILRVGEKLTRSDEILKVMVHKDNSKLVLRIPLPGASLTEKQTNEFFEISSLSRVASHAQELGIAPVVAAKILALYNGSVYFTSDSDGLVLNIKISTSNNSR
jgi:DNA-binding response OmpR family regulator